MSAGSRPESDAAPGPGYDPRMYGFDPEADVYRSAPRRLSLLARITPSWRFYLGFIGVVFRSSRKAKQGEYDDVQWTHSSHDTRRHLEAAGLRITVEGIQHVRALDGPCVFAGNHMSMLETVVLPGFIRPFLPVTYVVKQSLVEVPVFSDVLKTRDPITVGRTNPRADLQVVLEEGLKRLKDGISIIIFPQSTRTVNFNRKEFNSIGVKLARRAKVPVVPVAIRSDTWSKAKVGIKDFGPLDPSKPVHIAFGAPIEVTGRGQEAHDQTVEFIESNLTRWGRPPVAADASSD